MFFQVEIEIGLDTRSSNYCRQKGHSFVNSVRDPQSKSDDSFSKR